MVKKLTESSQVFKKPELRSLLLKKRLNMDYDVVLSSSIDIGNLFIDSIHQLESFSSIALYYPTNCEVETKFIHNTLIKLNKKVLYPKLLGNRIRFIQAHSLDNFSVGKFNIMEPVGSDFVDLEDIDFFVVPSLAVGKTGRRLGYGGGFYDKELEDIGKERILSFIYDFQFIETYSGENHDIKFSKVFTEKRFMQIN
jgi:5-formyltetrahydrofolate cyclo-ligase